VDSIKEPAMVAEQYLQAAYAGLQKSLQQEWQFLQCVTEGLGEEFQDVEQALQQEYYQLSLATNLLMAYRDN
jgi:hypothetical protein